MGEYPSLCVRNMHAVRTQCKHLAKATSFVGTYDQVRALRLVCTSNSLARVSSMVGLVPPAREQRNKAQNLLFPESFGKFD